MASGVEEVGVTFRPLSDDEIERYIDTGEPMDKAGAYGIQGFGATIVERVDGDYFAVMGLALNRLVRLLPRARTCLRLRAAHRGRIAARATARRDRARRAPDARHPIEAILHADRRSSRRDRRRRRRSDRGIADMGPCAWDSCSP